MSDKNENIRANQMIRKLRQGEMQKPSSMVKGGGEKIVRPDGSEVIKVKSNKRRSLQPRQIKEHSSNKRKFIIIASGAVFLLLLAITFSILLGYFNGNRFKSKVAETIVNVSGAEVELGKLSISSASSQLSKIDLKWSGESTILKSLKLRGIKADYGMLALIGGGLGSSSVGIEKGDLDLEEGMNNPLLNISPERPVDFKLALYQCSEFNLSFGKESQWSFKNGSVAYRISGENDSKFIIDSGDFETPLFGDFKIQSGFLSLAPNSAKVYLDMNSLDSLSSFSVDGTVGYTKGSLVDLGISLKDYPLKKFIDPRARRFFSGKIQTGKGTLKMNMGDIDSLDIKASVTSMMINVNDFEFLNTLYEHLNGEYYLRPNFTDESKMKIKWIARTIEITDIDLHQESQMRIKGSFRVDEDDQLSGILKVGLPVVAVHSKEREALKKVFIEDDGEYIWADIKVSGKTSDPSDDLAERLHLATIKESSMKYEDKENHRSKNVTN